MAHPRVASLLGAACLCSCAGSRPAAAPATAPAVQEADREPLRLEKMPWGTFRSQRFALAIGLPDGAAWRIDDHGGPWLRATHAPSDSTLLLRSWLEAQPSFERCHARGLSWNERVPALLGARIVEEKERRIAGDPGKVIVGIEGPNDGFVVALAASARKCTLLVFRTHAPDPEQIAGRLLLFAEKVVPSVEPTSTLSPTRQAVPAAGSH
jgi:hypothetical protein